IIPSIAVGNSLHDFSRSHRHHKTASSWKRRISRYRGVGKPLFNLGVRRMFCASMIVCLVTLAACGANVAPSADEVTNAVATVVTPPPTPTPPPSTPAGVGVASPNGLGGEVDVAENFDVNSWLEPG